MTNRVRTNKEAYALNPKLKEICEKQCKGFFLLFQCENKRDGFNVGIPQFVDFCRWLDMSLDCRYFGICHQEEVNDKGETEKPHFHLLIVVRNFKRLGTILDYVCDYFHVDKFIINDEGKCVLNPWLGCQPANNEVACVQYLVHSTPKSKDKKPYESTDILTNAPRLRDTYLAMDNSNPVESYLVELVEACEGSVTRICGMIPASLLRPWLPLVNVLCKEYNDQPYHAKKEFQS